jgi:uncharacterized protein
MSEDKIRYDILASEALRGIIRTVLQRVQKRGLPGDHHFYISFDTRAEGVRLSPRMREQYPQDMTIVLQHQFWDLAVTEDAFEVGLAFGGITERLGIPFAAITAFSDPSVQFGLQFAQMAEGETEPERSDAGSAAGAKARPPAEHKTTSAMPAVAPAAANRDQTPPDDDPDKPNAGGEVVRLDRFRKK